MKENRIDYSQFWSQAFDNMEDFVCFIDRDYNLVKANESFFKVFGDEKKLVGKKCFEIFHSLKNPFPGCPHGKMLETKVSEKGEFYEPSLKKYLSVTVTPIWGEDHKLIGSIHVAEDVTQLKEEGEKLKIRNDFIDKSMTPFAVGDPQGNILYANAACLKLWGYASSREVVGRPIIEFWNDNEKVTEIAEAYKNKNGWTGELIAKKKDGTTFDCQVVSNVVEDNSGHPLYKVSSFTDVTAGKRAEEALKKSELMCHAVLDQTFQFIGVLTPDGKLVHANSTALKFAGVNESDVLGKPFWETPWWRHDRELQDKLRAAVKSASKGQFVRFEANHPAADGGIHYVDFSLKPVKDESGNVKFLIPEGRDITERKHAEEALRESEEHYRTLLDASFDMTYVIGRDDRIQYVNPAALKSIGRPVEEVIGKSRASLFPPTLAAKQKLSLDQVFATGKPLYIEQETGLEGASQWKDTHLIPLKSSSGRVDAVLGVSRDITERKRAEEALQKSEKSLRLVLEHIDEALFIDDASGKLIYANDRFFEMYGFKPKDLGSIRLEDYIAPEYRRQLRERHDRRFQGLSEPERFEYKGQRPDGSWFWVEAGVTPITDGQGKIINTQTIARDVTARKNAEDALRESETRYKTLFTAAPEGIIITDLKTKQFRYVNPAICRMLGYTEKELMQLGVANLHPKEALDNLLADLNLIARGKKLVGIDLPCLRKDGTVFYANISGVEAIFEGRECTIGFFTDVTELKCARDEVAAAREYADNIIKSMIDALIVVDPNAKIKTLNLAALEMLGYREEELIGKPVGMILEEEEEEEEETAPFKGTRFKKLLKRGFITNSEMTWKAKSGGRIPVNFSGSAMRDRDGKLVGIVGVARDMREKKKAEDAIRKSQKQYVDLIDSINDWVWEVDAKGRYTFVSPRVKDVLGYAPEKIIGKTPFDLMPAKEARRVGEIFKQLTAEQKPIRALENINRHKDGHQVFVETSGLPFYDDEGNFKGYRGTDRDVTDRKKAATLLNFYKEYAENIVGHLPVSLIVVNRDLCINFANQHFLSKMRMTKENVTEKELAKVLGNSVVENSALSEKIMRVIKGGETRIEDRFILKSKTYDYMIVPIKEQTGRRLNALLVMEDVTKNVMMEEQLIHSEKLSAVGTFTASVAHEINNPLSIVVGNIQYLLANLHHMNLTKKKEIDEIVETLKTANSEAKRCSEIVTNLLHFSHKGRSEKTKISVNGVVTSTMRLLAHQLELSKVKTYIKLADGLPRVMCDADHLQQAFVNLILNAQQVMKEGGKLYVTTCLDENYVKISFRDTGPGIPKKYIRKIFEPFYSTREAGKGTGLGLFIIHSIMEEHGGKIEVQSKRGQGATFILKLPVIKKNGFFN